jgi:hypothetical protein
MLGRKMPAEEAVVAIFLEANARILLNLIKTQAI